MSFWSSLHNFFFFEWLFGEDEEEDMATASGRFGDRLAIEEEYLKRKADLEKRIDKLEKQQARCNISSDRYDELQDELDELQDEVDEIEDSLEDL